jgi:hypothetical protein
VLRRPVPLRFRLTRQNNPGHISDYVTHGPRIGPQYHLERVYSLQEKYGVSDNDDCDTFTACYLPSALQRLVPSPLASFQAYSSAAFILLVSLT